MIQLCSSDSGGSGKNESDGLVMDEEEDSRSSTGGSGGSRPEGSTEIATTVSGGKLLKKIIKRTNSSGKYLNEGKSVLLGLC